jgi:phage-related protein
LRIDWQIEYYADKTGNEPVRDFIDRQSLDAQAEIFHVIGLLQEFALSLGPLYVKKIGKSGIRELRIHHSSDYYRIFFFAFIGRRFVLLHAFLKKTAKTPEREINIALKRMDDYKMR